MNREQAKSLLRVSLAEKVQEETEGLPITLVVPKIILLAMEHIEKAYDMGVEDGGTRTKTDG